MSKPAGSGVPSLVTRQGDVLGVFGQRDPYLPVVHALPEAMLHGVLHQFVQNQRHRSRLRGRQQDVRPFDLHGDMLARRDDALRGRLDDLLGDFFDADDVQIFPRQQFMDGGDGENAVQALGQHLLDAALPGIVHLEAQQGGDLLQVVLDPVVHLLNDRRFDHQFGVFDGDGRMVAQRGQHRNLFVREVVRLLRVAVQDADFFVLDQQRDGGQGRQPFAPRQFRASRILSECFKS